MSPTDAAPLRPTTPFSLVSLIVVLALGLAAGLAWMWLFSSPMSASAGMGAMTMTTAPFSAAYLIPAFAMWTIMMVAMMLPSATPMILLHARVDRATPALRLMHTWLFAFAYLLVWTSFSAVAAFAQAALVASAAVGAASLSVHTKGIAASLLIAASLYELTAAKQMCLTKCQSPLLFLYRHWQPGAAGAFRLGIVHGLYCVGCCCALMLLLFVGGVMNLAWVALLGLIIVGQKFAPSSWRTTRWLAGLLAAAALAVFLLP